jgi:hypothetical protein
MTSLRSALPPIFLLLAVCGVSITTQAQDTQPAPTSNVDAKRQNSNKDQDQQKDGSGSAAKDSTQQTDDSEGKQPKRILWIFPNYRSVSANITLPPQSTKEKFWLATQDSFDYSSFLLVGAVAALGQGTKSIPEFGQGAKGYARYYWHSFADQAVGNYYTEAIVPTLTHEDPRFYTLEKGTFWHRAEYAVTRLVITRTDSGGSTFNFSEIAGNGAGAFTSNLYYPKQERTFSKTAQKWGLQVGIDGVFNAFKEFWPDINKSVFHQKY